MHPDNPIIDVITYFTDGNVSSIEKYHSERHLAYSPKDVMFPIGIGNYYNENSSLRESLNFDKALYYSYTDVLNLLKERKCTQIHSIEATLHGEEGWFWTLNFFSETFGLCRIKMNATTAHLFLLIKTS